MIMTWAMQVSFRASLTKAVKGTTRMRQAYFLLTALLFCLAATNLPALDVMRSIPPRVASYAYPQRLKPDPAGLCGQNAKAGRWLAVHFQRGGMVSMQGAVVAQDDRGIKVFWPCLTTALAHLERDGNFAFASGSNDGKDIGPMSQPTDDAFFLGETAPALLLLQQSRLIPQYRGQMMSLMPKLRRALDFIATSQSLAYMRKTDKGATNRLLIDAKALILTGLLTHDDNGLHAGNMMLATALSQQSSSGVFPERGGWDVAYQAVSILSLAEICLFGCSPRSNAALRTGLAWEVARVSPDGTVDLSGDTRTSGQETYFGHTKLPDWRSIVRALALSGALLVDDRAAFAAAAVTADRQH